MRAVVDESRRPWRRERTVAELPDGSSAGSAPGSVARSGHADAVATRQTLAVGLRQVPPRQRAVLVLRYLEGLDVAATAAAMRCSEGTVKSQTAHGLTALRAALGDALDALRTAQ